MHRSRHSLFYHLRLDILRYCRSELLTSTPISFTLFPITFFYFQELLYPTVWSMIMAESNISS
jgi:hypothetical protein